LLIGVVWFSVRARALGSFVSGIVAVISGNVLGYWLDRTKVSVRKRARSSFWVIVVLQGAWWTWATVNVSRFRETRPTYDWADGSGFGNAFAVFVLLTIGFQINYLFLYFFVTNLATNEEDVVRYAALLRGTESGWQALSYGLTSLTLWAEVGAVYGNFFLWAISIFPAYLVLKKFGVQTAVAHLESPADRKTSPPESVSPKEHDG